MPTAEMCVHCDVALVHAGELPAEEEAPSELPPVEALHCVRAAGLGWAQSLSERLSEAGIPHRIQAIGDDDDAEGTAPRRPSHQLPYGVYVRAEDAEDAAAVDAEHMQSQIPDLDEHDPDEVGDADEGDGGCPACGESVPEDVDECPGCGLFVGAG